jgi:hypothetical protein
MNATHGPSFLMGGLDDPKYGAAAPSLKAYLKLALDAGF